MILRFVLELKSFLMEPTLVTYFKTHSTAMIQKMDKTMIKAIFEVASRKLEFSTSESIKMERTMEVDARINVSHTGPNFSRNFIFYVSLDSISNFLMKKLFILTMNLRTLNCLEERTY